MAGSKLYFYTTVLSLAKGCALFLTFQKQNLYKYLSAWHQTNDYVDIWMLNFDEWIMKLYKINRDQHLYVKIIEDWVCFCLDLPGPRTSWALGTEIWACERERRIPFWKIPNYQNLWHGNSREVIEEFAWCSRKTLGESRSMRSIRSRKSPWSETSANWSGISRYGCYHQDWATSRRKDRILFRLRSACQRYLDCDVRLKNR